MFIDVTQTKAIRWLADGSLPISLFG